jgi:hypothetical protein
MQEAQAAATLKSPHASCLFCAVRHAVHFNKEFLLPLEAHCTNLGHRTVAAHPIAPIICCSLPLGMIHVATGLSSLITTNRMLHAMLCASQPKQHFSTSRHRSQKEEERTAISFGRKVGSVCISANMTTHGCRARSCRRRMNFAAIRDLIIRQNILLAAIPHT